MKTRKTFTIIILIISSQHIFGQVIDRFIEDFNFYKNYRSEKARAYQDIEGNPYLNSEFVDGVFYLKDTTAVKLKIRYNIYADEMEYQLKGIEYTVGNPESINKILLGKSVFVNLPFVAKGGYFELLESGKCYLIQKRCVKFKPAEGPKPIEARSIPAQFIQERDVFYILTNNSTVTTIVNKKSLLNALQDQKVKIESFIKQEKIKNTKKDNLIKIIKYYNSL
jgi:hypothetical protein